MMQFLKNFIKISAVLVLVCLGLYLLFPQQVRNIYYYFHSYAVPAVLVLVIVFSAVGIKKEN